jgi:hypothetical protein
MKNRSQLNMFVATPEERSPLIGLTGACRIIAAAVAT